MYEKILEYLKLQFFAKYDRLCITNLRNLKIIVEQVFACEKALNGFIS